MIKYFFKKHNQLFIYLMLIFIALSPCFIMFNKGYIWCHDNAFHYAQIQDLYDSIKSGSLSYYLNYETANYLGLGVRLMYGSFSHLITALIGILLANFGLSLTASMKLVIMLSMILSAISSYKLLYKACGSTISSILGATFFVLFPYRFCLIYVRNAYAETLALSLVPLVFLGVYEILNDYSSSNKPYIITIIAMTLLILTHNITAFYTAIFVLIYASLSFKKLSSHLTDKKLYLNVIISVLLILSMSSWFLFPLLESKKAGIYRVFDSDAMRTSLDSIISSTKSAYAYFESGLNFKYLNNLILFLAIAIILGALAFFFNLYYKKRKLRYLTFMIAFLIAFIAIIITSFFFEIDYIIYTSLIFLPIFYFFPFKYKKTSFKYNELISFSCLSIIAVILIFVGYVWKILPQIFYNIQFSWRLFGFLGFFLGMSIGHLCSLVEIKFNFICKLAAAILIGALFSVIKPLSINEYYYSEDSKWSEENSIKKEDTFYMYSAGWQLEYFTIDFFNSSPKSSFWWEIYYNLSDAKNGEAIMHPGLISGSASFANYSYSNGVISFDLKTEKESVIELARVYYKGYKVYLKDNEGVVHELEAFNNESYVAFKTDLSGEVLVYYKKTPAINAGICLSFIGLICFLAYALKKYNIDTRWD